MTETETKAQGGQKDGSVVADQPGRCAGARPGDRIEIGDDSFLIQGEPVRDRERLVWTVDLRPA